MERRTLTPMDRETYDNLPDVDHGNLPVSVFDDGDDDGIFMSWPEPELPDEAMFDDWADEKSESDEDAFSNSNDVYDDDGDNDTTERHASAEKTKTSAEKKNAKKKARNQKKRKKDTDGEQYTFRRAAASDLAESKGKAKKSKNDPTDNEATLSSLKYYKHTARLRELFLRRFLPILFICLFVFGFFIYFFRLQNLTFDNLRGYDAEAVFHTIGLKKNMFIFSVDEDEIEDKLRADFPYIQKVEVDFDLPNTAHLIFSEDCALFYTRLYDEYFVISESLRVLARYSSEEEIDEGLRKVTLPPVSLAVVGHPLSFFDLTFTSFLEDFLDIIEKSDIYPGIRSMDVSNRFDVTLNFEDRYDIELGNQDDIETKLLFVKAIISELEDEAGVITLIDNKKANFSAATAPES
ncbi:MAG: FtsQ-type POTRA domain-containing protein [Clostridia bacterium]|nr:FtsQ-type POTRA domain-containing protein [Clostridia bacterium]